VATELVEASPRIGSGKQRSGIAHTGGATLVPRLHCPWRMTHNSRARDLASPDGSSSRFRARRRLSRALGLASPFLAGLVASLLASPAWADPDGASPPSPAAAPRVDLDTSLFFQGANDWNARAAGGPVYWIGTGVEAAARIGFLRAGGSFDAESTLLGPSAIHAGAVLGPTWSPVPRLRFDLSGEAGVHYMYGVADGLFTSQVTGTDAAAMPFVGARAAVTSRLGQGHRWNVGGWIAGREDLARPSVTPTVTSCFFGCSTAPQTYPLGGESVAAGVRVGLEY
jgi:hypothetical protein